MDFSCCVQGAGFRSPWKLAGNPTLHHQGQTRTFVRWLLPM